MDTTEPRTVLLLVEDETIIALALAQTIRKFGYEVVIARSGEDAVEICSSDDKIQLVLMDIDLGKGIDGPEAARRILSSRMLPIVFCTSHSEKEYVERVKTITRYGYIIKNSGNFVLRSSIEMAFELFDAHIHIKKNMETLSAQLRVIAQRLELLKSSIHDETSLVVIEEIRSRVLELVSRE